MKKAGIGRAYIGNIWEGYTSDSMVQFGSDEWWKILRTALKRAGELDIEIGIFNSPGWSQSGGPWVRPQESMRYLAMSETRVKGPQRLTERLPIPGDNFQDVRVIAYPMPADYDVTMAAEITSQPELPNAKYLTDDDTTTRVTLSAGQTYTFDLTASQPFTARSLILYPDTITFEAKCQLQIEERGEYHTICEFDIDRRRAESAHREDHRGQSHRRRHPISGHAGRRRGGYDYRLLRRGRQYPRPRRRHVQRDALRSADRDPRHADRA